MAPKFVNSPELYDAIYHFKNYAKECDRLREIIEAAVPGARTILDVACGTGEHAKFLCSQFAIDGVDINEDYLAAARLKNPTGNYTRADMTDFDLGRTYDVVTCLFSAIGYVRTLPRLWRAIACMARHLNPGGILIVEPWLTPDNWQVGTQNIHAGEIATDKVCRMTFSGREGNLSIVEIQYLRGTANGIEHYSERLEFGLFTRDEMTRGFAAAGLEVSYDGDGLMGRGLYLARKISL